MVRVSLLGLLTTLGFTAANKDPTPMPPMRMFGGFDALSHLLNVKLVKPVRLTASSLSLVGLRMAATALRVLARARSKFKTVRVQLRACCRCSSNPVNTKTSIMVK